MNLPAEDSRQFVSTKMTAIVNHRFKIWIPIWHGGKEGCSPTGDFGNNRVTWFAERAMSIFLIFNFCKKKAWTPPIWFEEIFQSLELQRHKANGRRYYAKYIQVMMILFSFKLDSWWWDLDHDGHWSSWRPTREIVDCGELSGFLWFKDLLQVWIQI
jgi:hypothetical protein